MLGLRAVLIALLLPGTLTAQAEKSAKLDDAAIVGIFDAANTWDMETGSLAAKKAQRDDVQSFGATLARDHESVRKLGRDLAMKLGVTATPVPTDFALLKNHEEAVKKLRSLTGKEFQRAFLEHEIAYHKAVGDALNSSIIPAIQNAELKALVLKVGPAFHAHMVAAQRLLER